MENSTNETKTINNEKTNQERFKQFLMDQMTEVDKHKWIESEKARTDLGQPCILDWIQKYAAKFREEWEKKNGPLGNNDNQMETVVTVVRGDSLDPANKPCIFCGKAVGSQLFGVTAGKKYDGTLLRTFSLCEEHLDKLNALLS